MKILSPAGDFECLKQAVYAGADEVYLGVKDFNARNIIGFDFEGLTRAVRFAHAYNVKVHLAVNILFTNSELQSALDLIVDAYNIGVDAFIIQDIGLISLIHEHYPNITIHASTQLAVHNLEGVRVLERLGVKRVVLSRETPLSEITRIHSNSDIEIEYFVQGALCVCFSGNCYMSSYLEGASGNRGKCKQLCRLPYDLEFNNKKIKSGYLLSAKDFCMDGYLNELARAGVCSLKIEGRARRPYYVATATRYYRALLDKKVTNKTDLMLAFNRGFTAGYFEGNGNIISNIQGHNGILIGEVIKVNLGKKFNLIEIKTDYPVSPKSALKILRQDKEFTTIAPYDINHIKGGITLTTTSKLQCGDKVYLISDALKEYNLKYNEIKRPIKIHITAKAGENISAVLINGKRQVLVIGETLEQAMNSPLSEQDFVECFNKHEFFSPNISVDTDGVFLPKSKLNAFRRECYDRLESDDIVELQKIKISTDYQANILKDFDITTTGKIGDNKIQIYSPSEYIIDDIAEFKRKCNELKKEAYLDLPNVAFERDIALIKDIIEKTHIGIVVNNLYALDLSTDKIAGGGLNVYNTYSAKYYNLPTLIAENGEYNANITMPYMTLLHCPIKQFIGGDCAHCKFKNGYTYSLQGKKFKLIRKKLSTCIFYLVKD